MLGDFIARDARLFAVSAAANAQVFGQSSLRVGGPGILLVD